MNERLLTNTEWDSVHALGRRVQYPDGHLIVSQGAPGRTLFALERGEIRITVGAPDGSQVVVGLRTRGELVGEMAVLDGHSRSASMVAKGEVVAWIITADRFRQLLGRHPELAFELLTVLARRLRDLGDQHALRSHDLSARVAWRLRALVRETGTSELRMTQKELADWVGATREGTARVLTEFRNKGLVHTGRGRIEVLDPEGLAPYTRG